jgi:hypothetical protein
MAGRALDRLSNDKDLSARPVRSSAGLCRSRAAALATVQQHKDDGRINEDRGATTDQRDPHV